MKKMDGKSLDLTEQNIEKLKALFPQVVTENQIDFEKLRLILGDEVDTGPEKYQFTWPGKADSIRLAQEPSTKTLRPVMEDSKDWETTKNLYIEGDNLEVLKQLQKTYHGKVDTLYLDPPYNTGKDYIYKNDFYGEATFSESIFELNSETNSRFHSNWLNLMYPRLILAKNLLSTRGFILASIDHYELFNLGKIMDEVFGRNNRVAIIAVVHKPEGRNQAKFIGPSHEYLLVYAKNINEAKMRDVVLDKSLYKEYKYQDEQGPYKLQSFIRLADGKYSTKEMKPSFWYPIFVDKASLSVSTQRISEEDIPCYPVTTTGIERTWKTTRETAEKRIKNGDVVAKRLEQSVEIYEKMRPSEVIRTHWIKKEYHGYHYGTKILDQLLGVKTFDFPKSLYLMQDIIKLFSPKGGITLDFFSGSATTAHAVMKLNAEDGGNRQFIMVQLPEETEEKSEAYKAGYKNICEIGKERIRRSGEQIKEELKEKQSKGEDVRDPDTLDVGFKVFRLDETNIVPWEGKKVEDEEAQIDLLAMLEEVFKEDRSSLDIAYEIMLKYGVFDQNLEKVSINGKEMFDVGEGYMLICLSENTNMDDIQEIGKKGYMHVIFNDRSFKDDNVKLNAEHSLKNMGVEEVVSI